MFVLKPVAIAVRVAATVAFLAVPALLVVLVLPLLEGSGSYQWVSRVIAFDAALMDWVRSVVPTEVRQYDLARPFTVLAALLVGTTLDSGADRLAALTTSDSGLRRRFEKLNKRAKEAKRQPSLAPIESKLERLQPGDKKSRAELVRLMVEAKRELDAMSKEVAFLALDVVGSTNMKLGEDRAFIDHDFAEFKKMVDGVVARGRPLKAAWTPDGAMICFDSLERAVRGAQDMLNRLEDFNAGTRMMQTPFRVRCGINAGLIQYDQDTPMEEMSDNVIDVAGHMQKYADPDTIFVAADLILESKVKRGFGPADTEVDGHEVYVWRGPSADPPQPRAATRTSPEPHPKAGTGNATVRLPAAAGAAPASLGRYEVRRELGRGAMGIVYEGWDPGIERRVALKTVRPDQLDSGATEELVERFRREAQAAGRLSHPGIVGVYDFGQEGDTSFIAMEFIEGEELQQRIDRGERFAISEVVDIMTQLLEALDTAGKAGIVHRDIKPSNILVLPDGRVKITDFGIARVDASGLTRTGSMIGTPAYMSPEQLNGRSVDPRSDLFSCGVLLYQILTGEKPFSGNRVTTIIHKILEHTPPDPSKLDLAVPAAFDAVVRKAIAKRPDDRYQTGAEFAEAIRAAAG